MSLAAFFAKHATAASKVVAIDVLPQGRVGFGDYDGCVAFVDGAWTCWAEDDGAVHWTLTKDLESRS